MSKPETTERTFLRDMMLTPIPADGRSRSAPRDDDEIRRLRLALSAIVLEAGRCRGEQSYRDTLNFAARTAREALGKRGIER